jgi:NAD(P)-dependent dehydrogenase (short-subunit alcohol dehydrogenase family)
MAAAGAARAFVVTGASTGIGRATALRLARGGHEVFAGVRREADAQSLRAEGLAGLHPVHLDVTDPASIRSASEAVAAATKERGLAGLVNNAGITTGGPIEYLDLGELRRVFEVNTIGPVAVTQAFLPHLRTGRGRIVLVTSIGGIFALPIVGPYAASKHALEAIGDSLRVELRPWGIGVSIVEPGAVATNIFAKSRTLADEIIAGIGPEARERYETAARAVVERFNAFERQALPADRVALQIEHALLSPRPRTRYLVGSDARVLAFLSRIVPTRWRDALVVRIFGLGGAGGRGRS